MDTFLGSLVQLCSGEGGTLQTNNTGLCGECSQCLGHTGFAPSHGVCAFTVYIAQALGCSAYIGKVAHLLSETIANTSQHLGNRGNPVNWRADQVSLTKYLQDHGLWCRLVNQSIILVCHQKIKDTCVRVNWSRVDM